MIEEKTLPDDLADEFREWSMMRMVAKKAIRYRSYRYALKAQRKANKKNHECWRKVGKLFPEVKAGRWKVEISVFGAVLVEDKND
jgi:hypothetical protein